MAILATWRCKPTRILHRDLEVRSTKLPSWQKTGFASSVNDMLSRVGIITRPLGFATRGYSRSALRSLRTSHSFGRPDLASELPLVPRVHRGWCFVSLFARPRGSCVVVWWDERPTQCVLKLQRDFYQWSSQGELSMHNSKMANQISNWKGIINMNIQTPGQ